MEMSPKTVSSVLLPWPLWLPFFLTFVTQTTSSAPLSETSLSFNSTLLFTSGSPGHNLRNCSCSTPVQDCDEALANSLCRCHTVLHSALPPAGLREPGPLTVWVKELWVLEDLLNNSMVAHLRLSFCGVKPLDSQSLALLGLKTLRIHSALPEVLYPEQEITISPAAGVKVERERISDSSSSFHVTFLDIAVLNGLSALKAYSVVGSTAQTFSQQFPHLTLTPSSTTPHHPDSTEHNLLISFVY